VGLKPPPETLGAWSGTMILPICHGISRYAKMQMSTNTYLLSPDVFFKLKMHQNPFSAGGPGELTTLPQTLYSAGEGTPPLHFSPLDVFGVSILRLGASCASLVSPLSNKYLHTATC